MIKKEGLKVKRELAKLERNLGGIRNLERPPNAIFVIDTKKEHIAVTEANRLGIPGDRGGRHQLRPRPHRLRDPRQRRRDPLGQPHVPDHRRGGDRGPLARAAQARAPDHEDRGREARAAAGRRAHARGARASATPSSRRRATPPPLRSANARRASRPRGRKRPPAGRTPSRADARRPPPSPPPRSRIPRAAASGERE